LYLEAKDNSLYYNKKEKGYAKGSSRANHSALCRAPKRKALATRRFWFMHHPHRNPTDN